MDAAMTATVFCRTVPPGMVVEVAGEIDPESAPALTSELRRAIDTMGPQQSVGGSRRDTTPSPVLVLDLSHVDFMDSTGLHLLLAVKSWCEEAGASLRVAAVHGAPARVLSVCAFDRLIDIVPTSESALETTRAG
jgi:anti-sigma B factor antagonist